MSISPVIPPDLLVKYGGKLKSFEARDFVFNEGEEANFYFQLAAGLIKVVTIGVHRDRLHKCFLPGDSFGEPPLLNRFPYPTSALASKPSQVWMLSREDFLALLYKEPEAHFGLTQRLSQRLQYKSLIMRLAVNHTPGMQIMTLLKYYHHVVDPNKAFYVPFTRQEIADMLGLRVETVIRASRDLVESGSLYKDNRQLVVPVD